MGPRHPGGPGVPPSALLDSGRSRSLPPTTPSMARTSASRALVALLAAVLPAVVSACAGGPGPLMEPSSAATSGPAPDSFRVLVETSEGPVPITFHRGWAPEGVDRVWHLARHDYWAGARFYRVEEGFVAQWGFSGEPARDSLWRTVPLADEPVVEENRRGVVSFARGGPESRSYTLFVNYTDNLRLDTVVVQGIAGYPPLGTIDEEGMAVLDGLYRAYADDPPLQDSIRVHGNDYLRRHYPQLDSIVGTEVLETWP